jgi:hypothetical protein
VANRRHRGKFWYADWLTIGASPEEQRRQSEGLAARFKATVECFGVRFEVSCCARGMCLRALFLVLWGFTRFFIRITANFLPR